MNLEQLVLRNNQLEGNIPTELGNLSQLFNLDLASNQLSGSIPLELGNTQLETLRLSNNQLSGSLPTELSNLPLNILDFANNQFSGCIPSSYQVFCIEFVDMSNNPLLINDNFDDFCLTGNGDCYESILFDLKVIIQGPYNADNGLMQDNIQIHESFPLQSPYAGTDGIITDPNILLVNGNDAVVDWLLVELRDAEDPSLVIDSKGALLQRDGDVVSSTDGFSNISFQGPFEGNSFFIGIQHRNHLGIRNVEAVILDGVNNLFTVDFTDITLNVFGGEDAAVNIGGIRALFSGDANGDGQVNAIDKNLFWRVSNGQPYDYFMSLADFNLDGAVGALDKNVFWRLNNGKDEQLD